MSSFGRGRAWSSQNQNPHKEQSLRRPGITTYDNDIVKDIIDRISFYDIYDEHAINLPRIIQEIADKLTSAVNKDSLKEICDNLWKQALIDDSLTTKIAYIFSDNKIALMKDNNKEVIRNRFLTFLQNNYKSSDKDKVEDKKKFLNIVLLHAEVYYHMRLSNGNKLKVLAAPLIHYLEDLLQDLSEDNVFFIMKRILKSGKDLHAVCPDQMENLMLKIRQLLVKESYSPQYRAMLLLMIELVNNKYEIKNIQLREFYLSMIKPFSFEFPQKELKIVAEAKTENDELQEVDNNQQIIKEEVKNDLMSEQASYSKHPSIPRAIRGSGALDKNITGKDDNIDTKLNSLKLTSMHKTNKGWDHDDRFHKDYE